MRNDACWGVVHWWLVLRISDFVLVFKISGDVWLFFGVRMILLLDCVWKSSIPIPTLSFKAVWDRFRMFQEYPWHLMTCLKMLKLLPSSVEASHGYVFGNSRLGQQCRCRWATAGRVSRWILSFLSHGVYPIYHPFIDGCSILNQPFWSILGIPSFEESPPYGSIWRQGTLHCNNVTVVIVTYCNLKGLMCFRQGSQWESPWCLSCVTGATGVALLVVAPRRKPSWVCLKIGFIILF